MVETYKITKICPVCFSADKVYRSRARNSFERFINNTKFLSMYRCQNVAGVELDLESYILILNYPVLLNIIYFIYLLFCCKFDIKTKI